MKFLPPLIVHEVDLAAALGQSKIRVVDAEHQAVLGPRREHAVRFEAAFGDQIVDKNADVRLVPAELERAEAERAPGRVDAGDDSLSRGFFVTGRSVDLPGQIQAGDALGLQRSRQLRRLDEVVFDGVSRPQHHGIFKAWKRVHEIRLHISRQAHRKPVHINLARADSFRLQENLMALLVGETNDLVFERRAIPRTDAPNLAVEQRRARDVRANEIANAIVGMKEMAIDLRAIDGRREKRERNRRIVAALDGKDAAGDLTLEIDAVAIEARRRACFQPAPFEAACLQRFRQLPRRRLARAAGGVLLGPDVNQAVEKRAGRDDERAALIRVSVLHRQTDDAAGG